VRYWGALLLRGKAMVDRCLSIPRVSVARFLDVDGDVEIWIGRLRSKSCELYKIDLFDFGDLSSRPDVLLAMSHAADGHVP
jgi:hypothetical protein